MPFAPKLKDTLQMTGAFVPGAAMTRQKDGGGR
jgi:hypothetical protein